MTTAARLQATAGDINIYHARRVADQQSTFVVEFNTRLDLERLAAALRMLVKAVPILGCRLAVNGWGMAWLPSPSCHPRLAARAAPQDGEAALAKFTGEPGDPEREGPLSVLVLHEPAGDRLCFKLNHVAADAGGLRFLMALLAEGYSSGAIRQAINVDRGYSQILRRFRLGEILQGLSNARLPAPGKSIFSPGFAGESTFIERASLEPAVFQRLRACGQRHGATINDLAIASTYRVVFGLLEESEPVYDFPLMIPVDMRRYLPASQRGVVANLTSAVYPQMSRILTENRLETLDRVKEMMDGFRSGQPGLGIFWLMRIASAFGGLPLRLGYRQFDLGPNRFVNCSNVGVLDELLTGFGSETIRQAYGVGPIQYPPGVLTAVATYKERLHLVIQGQGSQEFQAEVRQFLEAVTAELRQYAVQ